MDINRFIESPVDPWKTLGLSYDAEDQEIRECWNRFSAEEQKNLRSSYEMIETEEARQEMRLLLPLIPEDLEDIQAEVKRRPRYSGPGIWYKELAKQISEKTEDAE